VLDTTLRHGFTNELSSWLGLRLILSRSQSSRHRYEDIQAPILMLDGSPIVILQHVDFDYNLPVIHPRQSITPLSHSDGFIMHA
jgi:hypothetical protein